MARIGRRQRGEGAFGFIVGLILLICAIIAGIKVIPLYIHGNEVWDAMNEAANFGGLKPLDKLQYDVFSRAEAARVPLPIQDIKVIRDGPYISISAHYTQTVDLLGFKYTYKFDKKVEKPVF